MSDEKKIAFTESDVLNALLHRHAYDQHFATQESVDNVKERLTRFEDQMDKQFGHVHENINEFKALTEKRFDAIDKRFEQVNDSVDKRFDLVDKRFEQVNESINELKLSLEKRLDKIESTNTKLLFLIIGLFFAGFSALYFK
ncbi:hypothetical protein [Vibrio scophthalmi]|uniref:Uncharacterized protein n=1 Tax=Vibrio scophthalmi LMG 19158 TaxID=870967 RepID=F9RN54_9VIBR|nr:hypothetical protein [Vibrio scophthalmi]EGU37409.1 hypothetical protein VIS19158_08840 [Vibrio scophthalmi LMG 19158]